MTTATTIKPDADTFVVTRVFDAPRDLVWKAHTEIDHLKHWWGPKGLIWIDGSIDLRPGGMFLYGMRAPNGDEMWGRFIYREIAAPERLVFVVSFTDRVGNIVRHPMAPGWPAEILNTTTLQENGGKTTLTIHFTPIHATDEERAIFRGGFSSMDQGFNGTMDQLVAYLPTMR